MEQHRSERVSETIREELSEIIGYEMSDPRISMVDVTEVLVTPDMRHARVRLHLAGDETGPEDTLARPGWGAALPAARAGQPAPPVPGSGAAFRSRPGDGPRRPVWHIAEARPQGDAQKSPGRSEKVL